MPSWELELLGQGECGFPEGTDPWAEMCGQGQEAAWLLIHSPMCAQGLWSKMDSAGCGAGAKDTEEVPLTRHKQRKPVPGGAREQRLTAECLAGTNPWCYGNLSLASIVVLATWGMPGYWEWGEPFLGDLLGLAWRCGGRMLRPGDLG